MSDVVTNLVTSALEFLESAAEDANKGDSRSLKFSLVHLATAVELLIKARLSQEHWTLLFADVNRANKASLQSGRFKSVDFQVALSRLRDIAGVDLDDSARTHLESLRVLRNQCVHFALEINVEQMHSLLAKCCNFVLDFCTANLPTQVDLNGAEMTRVTNHLSEFDDFVSERLDSIKGTLEEAGERLLECSRCWQETATVNGGIATCVFCGYQIEIEDLARAHSESEVRTCPNCGVDACGLRIANNDEAYWYCWACGEREEEGARYYDCPECGQLSLNDGICDDCWDRLMQKD